MNYCPVIVALGSTSHFEGIILAQKGITLQTGASINGRLLAQSAVTLEANTTTSPTNPAATSPLRSASSLTGSYTDAPGQSINLTTKTRTAPQSSGMQFYRVSLDSARVITKITVSGGKVVITYN